MVEQSATRQVTVGNPQGLHARPAHALVSLAGQFKSDVRVIRDGESVDGKSILSILTLAAEKGTELTLKATGEDCRDALDALEALFLNNFGLDEESDLGDEVVPAEATGSRGVDEEETVE